MYCSFHMSDTTSTKPQRKLTSLELSPTARGALNRLTRHYGWTKTRAIETALANLDEELAALKLPPPPLYTAAALLGAATKRQHANKQTKGKK